MGSNTLESMGFDAYLKCLISISELPAFSWPPAVDDDTCYCCRQKFGGPERACTCNPGPLKWRILKLNPETNVKDMREGHECYGCFDFRRSNCDKRSLKEQCTLNYYSDEEEERFQTKRDAKLRGEDRYKRASKRSIEEENKKFDRRFVKGKFCELGPYLKSHYPDRTFNSLKDMVQFAKESNINININTPTFNN